MSSTPNDNGSGRTLAIGVTLAILALLLLLLLAIILLRRRRLQQRHHFRISAFGALGSSVSLNNPANTSLTTSSSHQNHRIVPFGMPGGETPRFLHTPGQNMRIATRRFDGAWDFGDPRAPFTPGGVRELENVPSPSPFTRELLGLPRSASPSEHGGLSPNGPGTAFQFPPPKRSSSPLSTTTFSSVGYTSYTKEREAKREREKSRKGAFDECEPNPDVLPPPAYVYGHPHSDPYSPLTPATTEARYS